MDSNALVSLAMDILKCNQKTLAERLSVSSTQISKWKKGEYMSDEMSARIRHLIGIGDREPEFVCWAGSIKNADKWERLILYLADVASQMAETGYNTAPLIEENDLLPWKTFRVLREIGVEIPQVFPDDLDIDFTDIGEDVEGEEIADVLERNPYSTLIYQIYKSLNDVYGFYAAYISYLIYDDDLALLETPAGDMEYSLMSLAAAKLLDSHDVAKNMSAFRYQVRRDFVKWLTIVKEHAFKAGVPLKAELLDLAYLSAGELGHEAEAESLGVNSSRLHPDVYMNELLVGMRTIHQVLPAIMKKMGIVDEFVLDTKDLRN